jgi:hypothetical protein
MARFTDEQLAQIREIAESTGVCPTCLQSVSINLYGISPTMVETLKQMARITEMQIKELGERAVDVRKTSLDHNHRSSLSKLRQHGLIAKVKGDNDRQIAGHWLVTRKGYAFLNGSEVETRVEIFNNTVLGHTDGTTNIHEVLKADKLANDESLIENKKIAPAQAAALGSLREKAPAGKTTKHSAEYVGSKYNGLATPGHIYELEISPLVTGKPITMVKPYEREYKDISAFMRDWKIQR